MDRFARNPNYNPEKNPGLSLGYGVFNFKICKIFAKKPLIFQKL